MEEKEKFYRTVRRILKFGCLFLLSLFLIPILVVLVLSLIDLFSK